MAKHFHMYDHMQSFYPFKAQNQYAYSSYCAPYISLGADRENLIKAYLIGDHFSYSFNLKVWFGSDIVRRR